ncbi:unnamed protein product [Rotaria sp. Silwood1]|nr:unnamed protein product [Rotaria sp. Silwood1]CAF5159688.1 unnamed protein product [Rotaria sp. Silwood1]
MDSIARNQLVTAICPLYIYCCVSKRFRNQLAYVLIDIHLKRWRQWINRLNNNQVVPQLGIAANDGHRGETC